MRLSAASAVVLVATTSALLELATCAQVWWHQLARMRNVELERLLVLCDVLAECELLPAGMFRLWARANAIREIAEIITRAHTEVSNGNTSTKTRE